MKVLVLGATGSVGQHIVSQALERGVEVTVLTRDPVKMKSQHAGLRVVKGNALDEGVMDNAVSGQDAVIYALGVDFILAPTTLFSTSTVILLAAMKKHGVGRLVCITGIGAGDSRGHGGFLYDRVIFPIVTGRAYRDKDLQEELIKKSSTDWTIVRPGGFTNGPRKSFRVLADLDGVTLNKISRADVAGFVLDQLRSTEYVGKTPNISY